MIKNRNKLNYDSNSQKKIPFNSTFHFKKPSINIHYALLISPKNVSPPLNGIDLNELDFNQLMSCLPGDNDDTTTH